MREQRRGARRQRELCTRIPDLGYYIIITDTEETEACFFCGLRQHLPKKLQDRLVIKVKSTSTAHLLEQAEEGIAYDAQYRKPWIVFDRDRVSMFDQIISDAVKRGFYVGWSNPCFEIWLYAYFKKCLPLLNQRNAAVLLEMNFGIEWGALIKKQIVICMQVF